MSQDNRKRALAEVVSLEAWRQKTPASRMFSLHIDARFMEGRIGGDHQSELHFRLRLKRAQIVVILPDFEPAAIDKSSVRRDRAEATVSLQHETDQKKKGSILAKVALQAKSGAILPSANLGIDASSSLDSLNIIKSEQKLSLLRVEYEYTKGKENAWNVFPTIEQALLGSPWDAKDVVLKYADQRKNINAGLEPTLKVEVRCRREDLEITDIRSKQDGIWSMITGQHRRNKEIAAEAAIKTKLFEAGLLKGNISDPFTEMVIYATVVEE